jgi:hypothetical protein
VSDADRWTIVERIYHAELMTVALQRTLPERTVHVHVDDRAIDVENCECSQFSDFIGPEPEDLRCDLGQTDTRRQSENGQIMLRVSCAPASAARATETLTRSEITKSGSSHPEV